MGTVFAWMRDFALFGCTSGLVGGPFIASHVPDIEGGAAVFLVLFFAVMVSIQGVLAGLAVGSALRLLRGRVPAWAGLMAAVFAACVFTSIVPWLSGQRIGVESLMRGLPYTLAVAGLIPLTAVLRSRRQRTLPWMLGAGVLVGLVAHPWSEWVKVLYPGG